MRPRNSASPTSPPSRRTSPQGTDNSSPDCNIAKKMGNNGRQPALPRSRPSQSSRYLREPGALQPLNISQSALRNGTGSEPDGETSIVELIPALRAFARTFCRDVSDADDLVQETLTKGLANLD